MRLYLGPLEVDITDGFVWSELAMRKPVLKISHRKTKKKADEEPVKKLKDRDRVPRKPSKGKR